MSWNEKPGTKDAGRRTRAEWFFGLRPERVWRAGLLHLGLALLVLATTYAGFQSATPGRLPAVSDLRGVFAGTNNLEQSERGPYRWTDGRAEVCVPQAGRAPRSLLSVTVAGDYALALGNTAMTLRPGNAPGVTLPVEPGLRRYWLLSGAAQQAGDNLCLTLESPVAPDPHNNRSLGVPLYGFSAGHLPAAGPVTPAAGQLGLNLALALGALWLIRLAGAPTWAAATIVGGATLLIGGLVASALVPAGVGLARAMLPVVGGTIAGVAGLLGARAIRQHSPDLPLLARDLLGMAFWSALLVGSVRALQIVNGHHGVWPFKAGVDPHPTLLVALPAALFGAWLWLVLRGGRPSAVLRPSSFVLRSLLVLLGAVVIPVALEVSVLGWDSLYEVFRDSPYDYQRDTGLVGDDPRGFLGRYVDLAPTMALHNSNHPPGSVLLLWAVERLWGPGALATSWAAILLSALAAAAALWLGWRLGGPRVALLAGALSVAMPGHMIYSVTSMDGVFNAINALAGVAFFLCLEPPARPRAALLAGGLIALGLFFTYATTQLCFFGIGAAAFALLRARDAGGGRRAAGVMPVVRQSLIAAGTVVGIYLALYSGTGFNVVVAAREATAENAIIVGKQLIEGPVRYPFLPPSLTFYVDFVGANSVPYLWYLAPWGLAALSGALLNAAGRGWRHADRYAALLAMIGVGLLGMWLSGLFNREVERIWGFTYPLAAVLIARHALQGTPREQRWRAYLFPALFFALSVGFKLLLDTAW